MKRDLRAIHNSTLQVYEENAQGWDKQRSRNLYEKRWLDRFIDALKPQPLILDVGCGAGEPIARYLLEQDTKVTGIDASPSMIDICRARFPSSEWIVVDMRTMDLKMKFDGIIGWDSFFHLDPEEQRTTLKIFMNHLSIGGALLLTVGPSAGEVVGQVEGAAVYHSSLARNEYESILRSGGFHDFIFSPEDSSCGQRTILFASKFKGPRTERK